MGGGNNQPLAVNTGSHRPPNQDQHNEQPKQPQEPSDASKIRELIGKLDPEKDFENISRELMEKVKSGGEARLKIIMDGLESKAKAGNQAAIDFLRELARNAEFPLAQSMANDRLDKLGIQSVASATKDDPTNFLPYDTQVVLTLSPNRILRSDYSRALFTFGAFRHEDFENRIGINLGLIEKLIISCNKDHGHVLGVIRTSEPFAWDEVKVKLQVDPKECRTSKGKVYYLGKVDILSEFLNNTMPPVTTLSKQAAIYKKDDRTLVYGDEATIKEFIDNPPAPRITSAPKKDNTPPPTTDSGPGQPSLTGAGGGPSVTGAGSGAGQLPPGAGGGKKTEDKPKVPEAPKYEPYMTIDNKLRQLIELAEDKKESLGLFADSVAAGGNKSILTPIMLLKTMSPSTQEKVDMFALALMPFEGLENPTLRGAFSSSNRTDAELIRKEFEKLLIGKRDELKEFFNFDVQIGKKEDDTGSSSESGTPPPPTMSGGGGAPSGIGSGGSGMSVQRPGTGGAPPRPNAPNNPPSTTPEPEKTEDKKKPLAQVDINRREDFILVQVTIFNKPERMMEIQVGSMMVNMRTLWEMSGAKLRIGNLAQGIGLFTEAHAAANDRYIVPMGAYPRTPDPTRGPRPFPPSERVSWMPHLLNYLPSDRYQGLRDAINFNASWKDPANVDVGRVPISAFLNPSSSGKYFVRVRGVSQPLAVTDFVGMAGVGPDAPYYPKTDRRAGFFGYDRQIRLEDVKDGMENTIFMIQSDSSVVGPWIAGGGSTVRGTSEKCDRDIGVRGGFASPNYKGNPGVWVMMGDGSARFLTKDISPKVFEALCTINGGDDPGLLDSFAPRERLEATPITRVNPSKSTSPDKKKPALIEEDDTEKPKTPPKKP